MMEPDDRQRLSTSEASERKRDKKRESKGEEQIRVCGGRREEQRSMITSVEVMKGESEEGVAFFFSLFISFILYLLLNIPLFLRYSPSHIAHSLYSLHVFSSFFSHASQHHDQQPPDPVLSC
jgi:hypothetical protein